MVRAVDIFIEGRYLQVRHHQLRAIDVVPLVIAWREKSSLAKVYEYRILEKTYSSKK